MSRYYLELFLSSLLPSFHISFSLVPLFDGLIVSILPSGTPNPDPSLPSCYKVLLLYFPTSVLHLRLDPHFPMLY